MDIYENVVVGNFLFALGLRLGKNVSTLEPLSINLLQQTPMDQVLGDLVLRSAKLFRIVEFKRAASRSEKELGKLKRLLVGLEEPSIADLKHISREIHWYVRSDFRGECKSIEVMPYLEFRSPEKRFTLMEFVELTAQTATIGLMGDMDVARCRQYLDLLANVHGGDEGNSGCLVLFASSDGGLQFLPAPDAREFLHTPQQIIERIQERQLAIVRDAQVREIARERELAHERVVALEQSLGQSLEQSLEQSM